ncbi:MAG: 4Fe-4S dicluster domain-containing protein [Chloroflexales bacterium]|nr:4Fe-4S dicluster domain-containing protein [Chloroflexales bacterium]
MGISSIISLTRAMTTSQGVDGFRQAAENEMMRLAGIVPAGDNAVERLNTAPPGRGVNVMMRKMPFSKKIKLVPTFLRTMNSVTKCAEYMQQRQPSEPVAGSTTFWDLVQNVARENGAVEVGFVRISEDEIFEGYAIPYQNAIVFTVGMDKEAVSSAPSYDMLVEVITTYASLGDIAIALTEYLREHGYGAYPGFPVGGVVDYVRVAEQAGIGAIGYHGMLISPQEGSRQRVNLVFTNMEIPEPAPNPHEWILDFCARCQKCVRSCPPGAIFTSAVPDPITGRKSTLHYDKCLDYYGANQGCGVCMDVCPFSQAGYDLIQVGFQKAEKRREKRKTAAQHKMQPTIDIGVSQPAPMPSKAPDVVFD